MCFLPVPSAPVAEAVSSAVRAVRSIWGGGHVPAASVRGLASGIAVPAKRVGGLVPRRTSA